MNSFPAETLVSLLEKTLTSQGVDYKKHIEDFGQVAACEKREQGRLVMDGPRSYVYPIWISMPRGPRLDAPAPA